MRMTARMRVLAGAMAAAGLLAACSNGGGQPAASGAKPRELTLLTHFSEEPFKSGLKQLVDQWNATHDVKVKTQAVSFEDLLSTITTRQSGGQPADIIQAYGLWGGQLEAGHVFAEPPQDVVSDIKSNYGKVAVDASTADGHVLGYPTETDTYALYYNKKLLGSTPPPTSWDELKAIAAKTTKRDGSGNTQIEGFGLARGWDSAVVHPYLSLLQAAGGKFGSSDGRVTVDSDAGRKALAFEKDLLDSKVSDPTIDQLKGFPSGKIAMTINASWWVGTLKTQMGKEYSQVGVAPIPGPTAGSRGSLAYGFFIGVNSKSKVQKQAWDFLRWANAEKAANGGTRLGTMEQSFGTIPSRTSDVAALKVDEDPNTKPFIDAFSYAEQEPNPVAGARTKATIQQAVESVWAGGTTPADALRKAQSEINAASSG